MKYFSTFSGIGGFELGIQQAYESNNEYAHKCKKPEQEERTQRGKRSADKHRILLHARDRTAPLCIGYSEVDKYATQVYNKHFNHKNYGDITKIDAKSLPDFTLLVGGFPCQSFSIAGKRGGFADTRGTLFFDIARIVREKQPRLLLLENVKGLLSHDKGSTFYTIISTLDELGYDCQWQVLNSKNFGVPQNRERVFIVGHLRGTSRPEVFPIGKSSGKIIQEKTKSVQANCLTATCHKGAGNDGMSLMMRDGRDNRSCLRAGRTPELGVTGKSIRRLTPKECERLQGFPDDWTKYGTNSPTREAVIISDSQRYKMCGNAVSVPVVKAIMERLIG